MKKEWNKKDWSEKKEPSKSDLNRKLLELNTKKDLSSKDSKEIRELRK